MNKVSARDLQQRHSSEHSSTRTSVCEFACVMEACIARGGISHVLSQVPPHPTTHLSYTCLLTGIALTRLVNLTYTICLSLTNTKARASLKNPSRPYTPRSTARPLFHGDDYRPGSRPSSSYIVTEQRELQQKQSADNAGGSASPSASMLPSCSSASGKTKKKKKKTQSSSSSSGSSSPEDPDPSSVTMTASVSQLKLVHAPMISDDEEERTASPTSMHDDDADNSDADSDARDDDNDHLEASLELPSQVWRWCEFSIARYDKVWC